MSEEKEGYIIDYISGKNVRETPEEVQAVQPYARKLVEDYGYPVENIMVHPQYRVKARPSDVKKEYPVDIAKQFTGNIETVLSAKEVRKMKELVLDGIYHYFGE